MAERIICPKCNRDAYTTAPEVYGPCPYCGFVFNWRSPDRRVFERTKKKVPITLEVDGKVRTAETKDASIRGIGIIINSPFFIKKGEKIRCNFGKNDEMRETKVVWVEEGKDSQRVGLLFI